MKEIVKENCFFIIWWTKKPEQVEQLGGMNQNYLAKTSSNQYIVKLFGKGNG